MICKECGDEFKSNNFSTNIRNDLEQKRLCFTCNFWFEKILAKDNKNIARIDGNSYYVDVTIISSYNNNYPKGMGGREFTILFNDGRKVITNNLWHTGVIPKIFKDRLPDNAKFINED